VLDQLTGKVKRRTSVAALGLAPVKPTLLDSVRFSSRGRNVLLKFAFTGAGFDRRNAEISTGISNGSAKLKLSQGGIDSRITSVKKNGVTVTTARGPAQLVVRLSAAPGAFVGMSPVVGKNGRSIAVTLTRKQKASPHRVTTTHVTSTPTGTSTPTNTTPTHTVAPPPPPPPPVSNPKCVGHRMIIIRRGRQVVVPC